MKKYCIFLMILFITSIGSNSLLAGNIVNITKTKGGIFGYRDVAQTFNFYDQFGNAHWTLQCAEPGNSPCKLNPHGNYVNYGLPLPIERSLTAALPFMAEMELKADIAIINGATEGSDQIRIARPNGLNDIDYYDITLQWTYNVQNEETNLHFVIDEVNI